MLCYVFWSQVKYGIVAVLTLAGEWSGETRTPSAHESFDASLVTKLESRHVVCKN